MTVDEYRVQARKTRADAERTREVSVREQLLLMAAHWDKLAEQAEALDRRRRSELR